MSPGNEEGPPAPALEPPGDDDVRDAADADEGQGVGAEAGAGAGAGADGTLSRVSVTVDEEHLASLNEVVEDLRGHGMQVDAVLEGLGIVSGSAPDTGALRQVEGVSAVDAELEHRLPPPEDEIQ